MKGVVFVSLLHVLEADRGIAFVDSLIQEAGLPSGGAYARTSTYDDSELVALVTACALRWGMDVPSTLRALGRRLFPELFALHRGKLPEGTIALLESLEAVVHRDVKKLYPDAEPPRFECARDGSALVMVYRSQRALADLALGLVDGCIAHFGEPLVATLERVEDEGRVAWIRVSPTDPGAV